MTFDQQRRRPPDGSRHQYRILDGSYKAAFISRRNETILLVTASPLPQGWDLCRIRSVSGDESAEILDPGCVVIPGEQLGADGPVRAVAAFGFHDLAIVKLADDGGWHMGSLDRSTSAVDLWAEYDDFGDAVRGL